MAQSRDQQTIKDLTQERDNEINRIKTTKAMQEFRYNLAQLQVINHALESRLVEKMGVKAPSSPPVKSDNIRNNIQYQIDVYNAELVKYYTLTQCVDKAIVNFEEKQKSLTTLQAIRQKLGDENKDLIARYERKKNSLKDDFNYSVIGSDGVPAYKKGRGNWDEAADKRVFDQLNNEIGNDENQIELNKAELSRLDAQINSLQQSKAGTVNIELEKALLSDDLAAVKRIESANPPYITQITEDAKKIDKFNALLDQLKLEEKQQLQSTSVPVSTSTSTSTSTSVPVSTTGVFAGSVKKQSSLPTPQSIDELRNVLNDPFWKGTYQSVTGLNISESLGFQRRATEIKELLNIVDSKKDASGKWDAIKKYCGKYTPTKDTDDTVKALIKHLKDGPGNLQSFIDVHPVFQPSSTNKNDM